MNVVIIFGGVALASVSTIAVVALLNLIKQSRRANRADRVVRRMHHQCGMLREQVKFDEFKSAEALLSIMETAKQYDPGITFVESFKGRNGISFVVCDVPTEGV